MAVPAPEELIAKLYEEGMSDTEIKSRLEELGLSDKEAKKLMDKAKKLGKKKKEADAPKIDTEKMKESKAKGGSWLDSVLKRKKGKPKEGKISQKKVRIHKNRKKRREKKHKDKGLDQEARAKKLKALKARISGLAEMEEELKVAAHAPAEEKEPPKPVTAKKESKKKRKLSPGALARMVAGATVGKKKEKHQKAPSAKQVVMEVKKPPKTIMPSEDLARLDAKLDGLENEVSEMKEILEVIRDLNIKLIEILEKK